MPPRNDDHRLQEYESLNLRTIELLRQLVAEHETKLAVIHTKLGFIGLGCGIAGTFIGEAVKHLWK